MVGSGFITDYQIKSVKNDTHQSHSWIITLTGDYLTNAMRCYRTSSSDSPNILQHIYIPTYMHTLRITIFGSIIDIDIEIL